jgi:RND superfamily putative drug exporter
MLLLLFCIAFGLSMGLRGVRAEPDQEQHDEGAALVPAVTTGLARSGRIVSMAAVILSVSFFAFGTSSVSFIQLFGIGTGLAILIDAR